MGSNRCAREEILSTPSEISPPFPFPEISTTREPRGEAPRVCRTCVLPSTFPGIRFNEDGVCNYCADFQKNRPRIPITRERFRQKFLLLLNRLGERTASARKGSFDVLMAYSGGKDSSYTLGLLARSYGLRVLALTFDNGFTAGQALRNIQAVTERLGVDHMIIRPDPGVLLHAFQESIRTHPYPLKALERASSLCHTCMNLVKSQMLKQAVQMSIPILAFGWSPGQAPLSSSVLKLNPSMVRQMQRALGQILGPIMGSALNRYLLTERDYRLLDQELEDYRGSFLYAVHPLAFHEYDEERILEEIKAFGWTPPTDTDANSTNCLINGYASLVHIAKFGFHPYAFELAGLVRSGHLTREEGLTKIMAPFDG
jgi:tRNA(Ile)-lysidine synthase TilS/MesJ